MEERQKCSCSITSLYKAQNPAKLNDISFEGYIGVPFKRNEMINTTLLISSVVQLCLTLCHRTDCSTPGFPIHYQLPKPTQIHVHCISDAIQPSHPLLSPTPPAYNLPCIRVFSSESVLHIRWPNYSSFSFTISPSSEYSGLISFSIDWLDLLAVQGTLKNLSNTTVQKYQFFSAQLYFY